ncbi:MAG: hypothetical protein HQK54_08705 [Oligoflexales bacterium]|nr:hypothetical protein [Oligoflexales bacterium]
MGNKCFNKSGFNKIVLFLTLLFLPCPAWGYAQVSFDVDLVFKELNHYDLQERILVLANGRYVKNIEIDASGLSSESAEGEIRTRGKVTLTGPESLLSGKRSNPVIGFDLNRDSVLSGREPRIRPSMIYERRDPGITSESSLGASSAGTAMIYFDGSCPCAGEATICNIGVTYFVSIVRYDDGTSLWSGEFKDAILDNTCSFTSILGQKNPIPDSVLDMPYDQLALKFESSDTTQIIPLYRPLSVKGAKGDKGDAGPVGKDGQKGEKGDPGLPGKNGEKGDRGDKGDKGDKGDTGSPGEKGERGEKGDKGDKGEKGNRGETGKDGEKGEKGDKGDKGEKGERGEKGDIGEKGNPGSPGEKGEKGDKGDKGEKGDKGDSGSSGEKGEKGDPGPIGLKGEKGDKGDQGERGEKGEKGDKGDKGDQGIRGEKGDKGDKGDQGIRGEAGSKGDKGDKGDPGTTDIGELKGSIPDCQSSPSSSVCFQDDLLNLAGTYFTKAPTYNGTPIRSRNFSEHVTGSSTGGWNNVVDFDTTNLNIISIIATAKTADSTYKVANASDDFKVRVYNNKIQELHSNSTLGGLPLHIKIEYTK